ncbi:hypothetical protein [Yoonia sp. 67-2]|uniref:hypothetical protein n=1 Tax=Yoonia sp. 67-2 TaxID=3081448 RepID=UPI002B40BE1E|nr:hypothetical protein [Yoonia sp. 67-2]
MTSLHSEVSVQLSGHDGNAFIVLDRCQKASRRAKLSDAQIDAFTEEATAGGYDHLIRTALHRFNCS